MSSVKWTEDQLKAIEKKTDRDKYRHINNPKLNEHGNK